MKERPILFSAPMVRAILDGSKTQTRRVCKFPKYMGEVQNLAEHGGEPDSPYSGEHNDPTSWGFPCAEDGNDIALDATWAPLLCPYGAPGDRLWVRENFALHDLATDICKIVYQASVNESWTEAHEVFPAELSKGMKVQPFQRGWKPSIHMPRWACRIELEITDVRVERLQDISEDDAEAEGCGIPLMGHDDNFCRGLYRDLWEKINGKGSWAANPWVWCLSFKRVKP